MIQDILAIGDKIELKLLDKSGKTVRNNMVYVSQLIDFIEDNLISIASPIVYGKTMVLMTGSQYHLYFYTNKSLYECNCEVVSHYKDNNLDIAIVRIQSDLEKFQRRQYYRLECVLDTKYRLITKDELRLQEMLKEPHLTEDIKEKVEKKLATFNESWNLGTITDISGGGCRFNSDQLQEAGGKLLMNFDLSYSADSKRMILEADIVTSNRLENRVGVYEHRVKFLSIEKKDREDIIKYIFEQDRRRRKYDRT